MQDSDRLLPACALGTPLLDDAAVTIKNQRKLIIVCGICLFFMVCEVLGGLYTGSLALLSDAAHLFSDIAGFLISLIALKLTSRKPTERHSFGFHRAEVIGALLSVALVWAVTVVLVYEAVHRIIRPEPIEGVPMIFVASLGLFVNVL